MSSTVRMAEPVRSGSIPQSWIAPDPAGMPPRGSANALGVDPERLLLDAAALRRRQLCAAFLHGSARSWRVRRRIWPGTVTGLLIVAIVIAAMAVAAAFARQQEIDNHGQSQSIGWSVISAAPQRR